MIPTHLRATLGRAEITRSLRTQDRREALRRLRVWEGHIERLLTLLSRQGARMTREEIDRLVDEYTGKTFDEIENVLALDWSRAGLDQYGWDLNDRAHALSGALAHADPQPALELARELAPDAPEDALRKLARRLIEVQLRGIKATLSALNGEPIERPPVRNQATEVAKRADETTARGTPRLSELSRQYGDERMALKSWTTRTETQMRGYLALMVELLGDPPIGDVSKDDMRRFGLELTRLPARLTVVYPGKTAREALAVAGDDVSVKRLAPNSVNAYVQTVRSFFLWAVEHDHISQSPAIVLRHMETGRASDERLPFSDDDLRSYFRQLDAKPRLLPVEYWVPRILAYTGCRLGEAAQLCKHDIRQESGIWVIDINERSEDKRLKTRASRRLVPIHRRLIEIGFLDFVAAAPSGFLWPEDLRTASTQNGSSIDKLQKRLSYVFRAAIKDRRKKTAAHSFRHTVAARLKAHSIQDYQVAEILGHESGSMSTGRYGTTTSLATLKAVVELLDLPV
jgi:integrase